ncbi:ATP-binding cassette domain-containing protein [Rathayibacter sp. ZW T2_19]|uniref:ATP-binding cassette domain-containing protein n=1 Tax=Rathayibacter rubneri TaxID=2950106 RepID=A0A9X2E1F3_9MICO|nr:ATP-binding cassette domain-containing protein [Rathayibacter rubneri]MCM6763698.1 ATP-binding cassette domain-containing protein [Rathayibacter rubneri]
MIRTTAVTTRHGRTLAVDDVSLVLGTGLTAIIGPNGSGKSTLLSTIGRLLRAESGSVAVDDLDVATTRSRDIAKRLAILRQDNHFAIRLSVDDLVAYGRFPHGGTGRTAEDRALVDAAIDALDLGAVRERYLDELSGGQRQRAFVAMALAQDTDHLLLDEPLNNLDPRHGVVLMKLLRRLADDKRMTVVVVLHDINVAAQFADDIVAIRDGRVVHHGPVAEVLTAPRLEALYDTPVAVEPIAGRHVVLWL